MPAYYNVLSTEEMTYTEGGATATMSEALLCWLIPPYGWFKGVTAIPPKSSPETLFSLKTYYVLCRNQI